MTSQPPGKARSSRLATLDFGLSRFGGRGFRFAKVQVENLPVFGLTASSIDFCLRP